MFDYAHWPLWAQATTGLVAVLVAAAVLWLALLRPAITAFAKWSSGGKKLLVASVGGTVLVIVIWGINALRS